MSAAQITYFTRSMCMAWSIRSATEIDRAGDALTAGE
jgi:hypothetical protein